ncbi:Zinc finger C2H2-type [Trinorchestia longiramus]|nr:Zinc finger C2H2-type [Trinorchestia longiramus]
MTENTNAAPEYVELLVSGSMYNVIIDDNVETQPLELFPEDMQGVITDTDDGGANSEVKHSIRVYQAFKGVPAQPSTIFKGEEVSSETGALSGLSEESAQAVKSILGSPLGSELQQPQQHQAQQQQQQNVAQPIRTYSCSSQDALGSSASKKTHLCPHCDYWGSTAYNLKVHVNNRHTNEIKFQCDQCKFYSYTKASLNYHTKSHNVDEYQSCNECSYRTHSKSSLLNHMKTHQKERPFKCPHCSYAAARKMTLKEHMEVLHNARREIYECELCAFKTNWVRALKKHMKSHNGDVHSCSQCIFVAVDKQQLIDHETKVHNLERKEYSCAVCPFTTDQQYKLEDHVHKRHGAEKVLLYSCPDCDYKTKWKRLIKGHRRVHTGDLFRCSKCDFATITRTRLNEHEMTHLDMSQRSFACPHCSYRATRQTRLNEHITNRHYPEKKALHKCDKCEFSTLWKSYLKVHKKMHSGDVFQCSRCSYSSPVKAQVMRHERSLHRIGVSKVTTANNIFKCPHCPYTAARKCRLTEHIDSRHNRANSEVFSCPACTFKTIWRKSLKVHMSVHEEEGDYFLCDLCAFKSLDEEKFKLHVKTHLPEEAFTCTLCSFSTPDADLFNEHLTTNHSQANSSENVTPSFDINYIESHSADDSTQTSGQSLEACSPELVRCKKCSFSSVSAKALRAHLLTHLQKTERACGKSPSHALLYRTKLGVGAATGGRAVPKLGGKSLVIVERPLLTLAKRFELCQRLMNYLKSASPGRVIISDEKIWTADPVKDIEAKACRVCHPNITVVKASVDRK